MGVLCVFSMGVLCVFSMGVLCVFSMGVLCVHVFLALFPKASPKSSFMGSPTVQCTVEGTQENVEGIKSVIIKLHEYYGSEWE